MARAWIGIFLLCLLVLQVDTDIILHKPHYTMQYHTIPYHHLIPFSSQISTAPTGIETGPCKGEYCPLPIAPVVVPIFLIVICCSCCCLMMFCRDPEDHSAKRIVYKSPDDLAPNNRIPIQPNTKIEDFFDP